MVLLFLFILDYSRNNLNVYSCERGPKISNNINDKYRPIWIMSANVFHANNPTYSCSFILYKKTG